MARHPLVIKIANLLVFVFFLGANIYTGFGPDSDDSPYHGNHQTYISPAPFVFWIWGLIHFLFGGFVIYQFFTSREDLITDGISWQFVVISLLNALWLYLWQVDQIFLAWVTIIIIGFLISYVDKILKANYVAASLNEKVWVHAPFSLYYAWTSMITTVNVFAVLKIEKHGDDPPSILVKSWVAIILLLFMGVGIIVSNKGIAFAAVIAWFSYGIFVEQNDPVIHWSALVLAVITTLHLIKSIIQTLRNRSGGESTPLLE